MEHPATVSERTTAQPARRPDGGGRARRLGLALGPVLALTIYFALPGSLPAEGQITAAIAALMAVWWATEAIPIPATALLPLVLFPLFGVATIDDIAAPYANDVIFLFMGGFMLALAMQRWQLHRRFALAILTRVGTSPSVLIAGFMLATGFITMWVSNTATTVLMLPIGTSVIALLDRLRSHEPDHRFATALMLGIAYAATIGSVSTIIGTPPNALMVAYLSDTLGIDIRFGQWMLVGAPVAAVFGVLAWLLLTKVIYRPRGGSLPGARALLRDELAALGPVSRAERLVLIVFALAAVAWIALPLVADDLTSDAGIAMIVAVALFVLPAGTGPGGTKERLLDWQTAERLPWGILLLFGGGIALSSQFSDSGLSAWIGQRLSALDGMPLWLLVLVGAGVVLLLTELTSNTATTATFLPVLGGVAMGLHVHALTLIVPCTLAASMAFMLPVATPPNAIVFGTGHVTIGQMVRGGAWLNLVALALVMAAAYTVLPLAFGSIV